MFSIQHLRLDDSELPSCDRTPPCSPFEIKNNNFCFRKGPDVSVVYQPKAHPKQAVIDGEIWPPIFKPSNVRSAKRLSPREEDVMIVTYPKCGTTWLQHICHQLLRKDECAEGKELCKVSPMIERMGGPYCDAMETPRILKTHFSRMNCPKNDKAKYIYAVRNPKDCAASYFHHNRNFKIYNWADGEWATFVDLFLSGQLAFGDYFDHLLGWIDHCRDENMLFLRYEDMLADLRGSIVKIGEFLGGVAAELVRDPDALDAVVRNSSIDAMKKDQGRWFPETQLKGDFIRKGGSRDWKNYFTKEQSDRMDALFRTRLAGTPAADWWYEEMRWEENESTCEEEQEEECEESVSRRGSFCSEASESRRGSCSSLAGGSVCSTGYGSVWTRLMKTRVQMRSIPAISINTQ